MSVFKFEDWQLSNIKTLGIDLPTNQKIWLSVDQIRDAFEHVDSLEVNPLAISPEGSLGYQFYEWLAEANREDLNEKEGWLYAARHFSWNYPQLKMVFHDVAIQDGDYGYYTDGVKFLVEFYE